MPGTGVSNRDSIADGASMRSLPGAEAHNPKDEKRLFWEDVGNDAFSVQQVECCFASDRGVVRP